MDSFFEKDIVSSSVISGLEQRKVDWENNLGVNDDKIVIRVEGFQIFIQIYCDFLFVRNFYFKKIKINEKERLNEKV